MAALYQLVAPDGRLLSLSPVPIASNDGEWSPARVSKREPFRNDGKGSWPRVRVLTPTQYRQLLLARAAQEA